MNDSHETFEGSSRRSHFTLKQAEEELRESQRKLSTLIHNLPGAVYRFSFVPNCISEGNGAVSGILLARKCAGIGKYS